MTGSLVVGRYVVPTTNACGSQNVPLTGTEMPCEHKWTGWIRDGGRTAVRRCHKCLTLPVRLSHAA